MSETNTENSERSAKTNDVVAVESNSLLSRLVYLGVNAYLEFHPHGSPHPITLPVITKGSRSDNNSWTWNGDTEKPTLRPSVKIDDGEGKVTHLWLNDGICQHLDDSTDGNAGKTLTLIPLC